jgi:hypothetical protein
VVQLPTTPAQPDAERRLRSLAQERQLTADANDRQRQQETPASPSRRTHAQAQRRLNTGGLLGAANYWLNPDTWLYYMEQNRPGVHITFRF